MKHLQSCSRHDTVAHWMRWLNSMGENIYLFIACHRNDYSSRHMSTTGSTDLMEMASQLVPERITTRGKLFGRLHAPCAWHRVYFGGCVSKTCRLCGSYLWPASLPKEPTVRRGLEGLTQVGSGVFCASVFTSGSISEGEGVSLAPAMILRLPEPSASSRESARPNARAGFSSSCRCRCCCCCWWCQERVARALSDRLRRKTASPPPPPH